MAPAAFASGGEEIQLRTAVAAKVQYTGAMRTFTLREAQSMLPVLESLLRKSMECKERLEEIDQEFSALGERIFLNGGTLVDLRGLRERKAERDRAADLAKDTLAEIDAIGVQVKDLESGLLDFPCMHNEEVILLCWKMGEPTITHYHGTEEGFAGRRPIEEIFPRQGSDSIQ
ncbi:MAG: DUF2203 domain-containing protein [Acidobacteriota bacterium]|nr:DUF2203 domain-containing protein [Acidobacteriota bacterium]